MVFMVFAQSGALRGYTNFPLRFHSCLSFADQRIIKLPLALCGYNGFKNHPSFEIFPSQSSFVSRDKYFCDIDLEERSFD